MARRVTFHLPRAVLDDPAQLRPFYVKLMAGLPERGIKVDTVWHHRPTFLRSVDRTPGFHIADHGSQRHARVLNTGIAYVFPFWNCDPWGIRALSSIADMPFDAGAIDGGAADAFLAYQRRRNVVPRISRGDQPVEVTQIARGCIAVFLQSEHHRDVNETCYLAQRDMIAAVCARADPRPIVIKPHPRDPDLLLRDRLTRLAAEDARVRIVDANIHDILSQAAVAVTINSATGLEAMLHNCPVVLCGRADFHHCAVTVTDAAEMEDGIARAMATAWPFAAFVFWYLGQQCLNAGSGTLIDDFLARIAGTGFAL